MSEHDTIAAIATPPGRGAIAIVRCSGRDARRIAARVFQTTAPLVDRVATFGTIVDGEGYAIDRGLAIAMDAPRTATGEDVVELHVHGSPVTARETLHGLIVAGARLAEPGEFTRRAYLNGKLDLSAAEAVADLIEAESRAAARAAAANLQGGLRRVIDRVCFGLREILEELAGAIDFPDEVPAPDPAVLTQRVSALERSLEELTRDAERGRLVREGVSLAIVGAPNAGKSSLLNAFVEEDRAIVSPIAGTTRDTIEEAFSIEGVLVRAIDTAGLRVSDDPLERIGIERARVALESASVVLVVIDGSVAVSADTQAILAQTRSKPRVVFFNKGDIATTAYDGREPAEHAAVSGSVFNAQTVATLRDAIAQVGWRGDRIDVSRPHLASARQAQAVARASEALVLARATLNAGLPVDLLVGDLLVAIAALGEISGGIATQAVIDGIFSRFCVGK